VAVAGRYDITVPTRFLAPIEYLKIPALKSWNYSISIGIGSPPPTSQIRQLGQQQQPPFSLSPSLPVLCAAVRGLTYRKGLGPIILIYNSSLFPGSTIFLSCIICFPEHYIICPIFFCFYTTQCQFPHFRPRKPMKIICQCWIDVCYNAWSESRRCRRNLLSLVNKVNCFLICRNDKLKFCQWQFLASVLVNNVCLCYTIGLYMYFYN
jgi:hypothetical protein